MSGDFAAATARLGAGDPDAPVPVAAGELREWGWWAGVVAGWLAQAPEPTALDAGRQVTGAATREAMVCMLTHVADRVGLLLDGEELDGGELDGGEVGRP